MKLHMDWSRKRGADTRGAASTNERRQRVGGALAESLGALGGRLGRRNREPRSDRVGISRLREVLDRDRALLAANPEERDEPLETAGALGATATRDARASGNDGAAASVSDPLEESALAPTLEESESDIDIEVADADVLADDSDEEITSVTTPDASATLAASDERGDLAAVTADASDSVAVSPNGGESATVSPDGGDSAAVSPNGGDSVAVAAPLESEELASESARDTDVEAGVTSVEMEFTRPDPLDDAEELSFALDLPAAADHGLGPVLMMDPELASESDVPTRPDFARSVELMMAEELTGFPDDETVLIDLATADALLTAAASAAPSPSVPLPHAEAINGSAPVVVCREPIRTRTMARLLASQGHPERALSIYDFLLSRSPTDEELRTETETLRATLV